MTQKIRDLMTTDLVMLEGDRPVAEAARKMREKNVGDVLVTRNGGLAGILTDRDIVVRCIGDGNDPNTTTLDSVCSRELMTLSPDDGAEDAVRLFKQEAIRRLPVVEGNRAVGIVTIGDLAMHRDEHSALGAISAAAPNR